MGNQIDDVANLIAKATIDSSLADAEKAFKKVVVTLDDLNKQCADNTSASQILLGMQARAAAEADRLGAEYLRLKEAVEAEAAAERAAAEAAGAAAKAQKDAAAEAIKVAKDAARAQKQAANEAEAAAKQQEVAAKKVAQEAKKAEAETNKVAGSRARGFLEISRAVEDAQYGFSGVLNNIPNIISMFGGPAGLAAGISLAGVALNVLLPKLRDFIKEITTEKVEQFNAGLSGMKARLEDLEKKQFKVQMDYTAIDQTKAKIDKMQQALDAFNAAKNSLNSTQEKIAAGVKQAVVEYGGADDEESGAENIEGVIKGIRQKDGTLYRGQGGNLSEKASLEKQIAGREAVIKANEGVMGGEAVVKLATTTRDILKGQLADLQHTMDTQAAEDIHLLVGNALKGKESARKKLEDVFMQNRGAFRGGGVGDEFGAAIVLAAKDIVKDADKDAQFIAKQESDAKAAAAIKKNKADALKAVNKMWDDAEKSDFEHDKDDKKDGGRIDRENKENLKAQQDEAERASKPDPKRPGFKMDGTPDALAGVRFRKPGAGGGNEQFEQQLNQQMGHAIDMDLVDTDGAGGLKNTPEEIAAAVAKQMGGGLRNQMVANEVVQKRANAMQGRLNALVDQGFNIDLAIAQEQERLMGDVNKLRANMNRVEMQVRRNAVRRHKAGL